jgi:hypothetical protein
MRDAIRPDAPKQVTAEPAPAPPSHHPDVPDLRLPESRWDRAPTWIMLVYALAFFAPITFSAEHGLGFVLFLWGLLLTVAYPLQFWKEPAAGCFVTCWLANPLFWIGLSLAGSRQRSRRLLGGVYGACAALMALAWLLPWNDHALVGPAYLLWCGSFVLLAVAGLLGGAAPAPGAGRSLPHGWGRLPGADNFTPRVGGGSGRWRCSPLVNKPESGPSGAATCTPAARGAGS